MLVNNFNFKYEYFCETEELFDYPFTWQSQFSNNNNNNKIIKKSFRQLSRKEKKVEVTLLTLN